MKQSILCVLTIALLFSIKPEKSNAQITAISIYSPYDAIMPSYCVTPAEDSFMVYGWLTGMATTADSVTLNVNFDDGFDTIVKVGVAAGTGSSYYATIIHHINLPGTYST